MLAHPGGFIVLLRKSIGLEYSLLHFQRRHRVVENLVRAILVHILHVNEELDPVFPRSKPRSQLLIIPRIVALGGVVLFHNGLAQAASRYRYPVPRKSRHADDRILLARFPTK